MVRVSFFVDGELSKQNIFGTYPDDIISQASVCVFQLFQIYMSCDDFRIPTLSERMDILVNCCIEMHNVRSILLGDSIIPV